MERFYICVVTEKSGTAEASQNDYTWLSDRVNGVQLNTQCSGSAWTHINVTVEVLIYFSPSLYYCMRHHYYDSGLIGTPECTVTCYRNGVFVDDFTMNTKDFTSQLYVVGRNAPHYAYTDSNYWWLDCWYCKNDMPPGQSNPAGSFRVDTGLTDSNYYKNGYPKMYYKVYDQDKSMGNTVSFQISTANF